MSTTNSLSSLSSLTDSIASSASGTSSSTTGTGLGQGINVQEFVQYAVSAQQAQITALQTEQTALGTQTGELSTISTDLSNLDSAVEALNDPLGALSAVVATSSNSSVVSATASSTAASGSHTITVTNLATTSSYYTNELSSSSSTISPGSFQIQVGSNSPVTITVNSSDNTLSQLASTINSQNAGVTASVIQDANGYRLALVSNSSGAQGDIKVSSNTTGLSFTKAVTGTNASLTVDGIPISSASNTVSNVISGVTLNLGSALPDTPVTVNVSPDTSQATTAINNFVSAWNTAIKEINNQFTVGSDGTASGPLEADDTLQQAQSMLLSAISYSISGNNGIVNLASIGVNMNDDGTLTVDNGTLNAALSSNYSAVQNLMQNATTGFAQNLDSAIQAINAPGTGILSIDSQSITNNSNDLTQQINDLQAALATQEATLTTTYSQVNDTLEELPLLESQLSQQLTGISSSS
jgi:flagellar hook-associated protein 2